MSQVLFILASIVAIVGGVFVVLGRKPAQGLAGLAVSLAGITSLLLAWLPSLLSGILVSCAETILLLVLLFGLKTLVPPGDMALPPGNKFRHVVSIAAVWLLALLLLQGINVFCAHSPMPAESSFEPGRIPAVSFYWPAATLVFFLIAFGAGLGSFVSRGTKPSLLGNRDA